MLKRTSWMLITVLVVVSMLLAACGPKATPTPAPTEEAPPPTEAPPTEAPPEEDECMGGAGGTVSMIGVWSADEEATFKGILDPFLSKCNITLEYEGTRDLAVYSTRIEGGNPPDIAGLPNPGLLAEYKDYMVPLGSVIALDQYSPAWQSLGSVEGTVYGAFFKADTKSLVWYSPPVFDAMGYEIPTTFDELEDLANQIVDEGGMPFSCGIESGEATGWVSTDWIQDLLLRMKGADFVEQWARHEIPWTDSDIGEAFELYRDICGSDTYALGGAQGTLNTSFLESLYPPFEDPPGAYMVRQASFAGGVIGEQFPDLVPGEDYTFFMFPEMDSTIGAPMQGGADVMALFNADNAAAVALMNYMFGEAGGKELAASGWGLSPNNNVTAGDYASALQGQAATLMNEAPAFSFDADDRFPGGLNVDYWQAVVEYLGGGDLDTILTRMEQRAKEVYGEAVSVEEDPCMGASGGTVSMIGVWSADEEATFKGILEPFLSECNFTLEYEGTRDLAVYSTRIEGGNPPDIAGLPNPGLLAQYKDYMVPLGGIIDLSQYSPAWQSLGSVEGTVYGGFFKADTKSLVWYSPPVFDAMGYEIPATYDALRELMEQIVADGGVAWSCGIESGDATGWVSTDWIQDILLRTQGADYVEQWARHEIPWTDPAIKEAFEVYYDICAAEEEFALGGAQGTLNTSFLDSLYPPFEDPPRAYMVRQASFAGGVIGEQFPDLVAGEDYTFFMFPAVYDDIGAPMQGGADVMALFNADNAAAVALMKWMFGAEGGKAMAASGWGLSPNSNVTAGDYESALQGQAATLMNEAPAFSFDADDRFPGGLNVDYWQAVVEYLGGGDLDEILARMEARANEVY
jgi:alpha-glucoside transport system substrate-binding protein